MLPLSDYEKLLADLGDLTVVAERRGEPIIPHEQFVSERLGSARASRVGLCALA